MTPSGIEPMTFLFIVQCLTQLRHQVPLITCISSINERVSIRIRYTYCMFNIQGPSVYNFHLKLKDLIFLYTVAFVIGVTFN
jgi:hypothetical protein